MPLPEGLMNARGELTLSTQVWPETGALGVYPRWSSRTTDATMAYHFAVAIPLLAHLVNRYGLRGPGGRPFRFQHVLVGKSAASKSTAWRRAQGVYEAVCHRVGISPTPGELAISGSVPGLFEALGDMREPDTSWHYGILWHEEVSTFLRNTRNEPVAEFLCMLADGTKYERHLRGVKAQNRLAAGSAVESIADHAFQGIYITTFDVIRQVARPEYVNGGAFSRWGWFVGPDHPHHEMTYEDRLDEREAVVDAFVELLQWVAGEAMLYGQQKIPFEVTIDKRARDAAIRPLYEELLREQSDPVMCVQKRGLELATQYAAIFAISDHRLHATIEDYTRAANLVAFSLEGYRRLLPRIGASGGSATEVARSKIDDAFAAIVKAGDEGLTRSDLHKILSRPGKQVIDEITSTLLDEAVIVEKTIKPVDADGKPVPGRPTVRYVATAKKRTA